MNRIKEARLKSGMSQQNGWHIRDPEGYYRTMGDRETETACICREVNYRKIVVYIEIRKRPSTIKFDDRGAILLLNPHLNLVHEVLLVSCVTIHSAAFFIIHLFGVKVVIPFYRYPIIYFFVRISGWSCVVQFYCQNVAAIS